MTILRTTATRWPLILFVTLVTSSIARAQDSFREDLRSQPYVYGAVGGFPSGAGGEVTYGVGVGYDWLAYGGLGIGFDLSAFGNGAYGFGVATAAGSYHFVPSSSRVVPFVKAGIGGGGEFGYGGVTFGVFGGGVNLWSSKGAAIRIEILDRFPIEGGDHHINLQVGLTF